LKKLVYRSFNEYLQSPVWFSFVERFRLNKGLKCAVCGTEGSVVLKHRNHERLGKEEFEDVVPLCKSHVPKIGEYIKSITQSKGAGVLLKGIHPINLNPRKTKSIPAIGIARKKQYHKQWLAQGSVCPECKAPMKPNCGYTSCIRCKRKKAKQEIETKQCTRG
jgi:uncharacterized Zn finger protein (UPF0148 family)